MKMEFEPELEMNELTAYDAMLRFLDAQKDRVRNRADLNDLLDEMRYVVLHKGAPVTNAPEWWSIWMKIVRDVVGAPATDQQSV